MSYMKLRSGDRHHFGEHFTPKIEDIAFALANTNRYGGHVGQYSVAQHCVLVAMQLPPELQLSGLMHDAPEAYIGDVPSPLKVLLPEYKSLEQHYHSVIDQHFDVWTQHDKVKEVDLQMLITEAQYFDMWERDGGWPDAVPLDIPGFHPLPAQFAERAFLDMFKQLTERESPHQYLQLTGGGGRLMANSDHMAACLRREEARVALAELRQVMQYHNLSMEVTDHGDAIEILIGHDVVKTIDCGPLDAESLEEES